MVDKLVNLIRIAYRRWQSKIARVESGHPDDEALVCFLEGRLTQDESKRIQAHLVNCNICAQAMAIQLKLKEPQMKDVPLELIKRVKDLATTAIEPPLLEIFLRLKEEFLEVLNTTGDILVGQELIPAPVLRSRQIKDFKDEVIILKDFQNIVVEIKVTNHRAKSFSLSITAKEKSSQKVIKDLRITLLKDDLELESYLSESGSVVFENVLLGRYTISIFDLEQRVAGILLDIKV